MMAFLYSSMAVLDFTQFYLALSKRHLEASDLLATYVKYDCKGIEL